MAETFHHVVGREECSINTIASIMQSDSVIKKQWSALATALDIPIDRVKNFRQDLQLDKITLSDVIYELLETWVCQSGRDARLILLIKAVEEKCKANLVGEVLRLRFNLPCRIAETNPSLMWNDLSQRFQDKVRDNFKKFFPDLVFYISLAEKLERDVLIHLMTGRKPPTFKETIPTKPSYYVNRRLIIRRVISSKIFEENLEDVFLFTGLERHDLGKLVRNGMTSSSTEQLRQPHLTAKFIILEQEQHFDRTCLISSLPVHLLRKGEDGRFTWIKSKGAVNNLLECLSDSKDELDEETFCEEMNSTRMPVCISDSPGMGKSVLLHQIGRELKRMHPDRLVFFILMPELLNLIKKQRNKYVIQGLENALLNLTCENKLGEAILEWNLQHASIQYPISANIDVELLIDGFDEVDSRDLKLAHDILDTINEYMISIRLWVTSRPHQQQELESNLRVIAYNIKPFDRSDQVRFLMSFWSQDKELNQEKLKQFATSYLDSLHCSMKSVDRDLTGIPLQCLLIGETFEEEVVANAQPNCSSCPAPACIEINSVTNLYSSLIKSKIQKYKSAYGKTKLTERELMYMHAYLGLELIFPDVLPNLHIKHLFGELKMRELFKVGILEKSNTSHAPRFIHQTIAEYFIAWFVVERISEYLAKFAPRNAILIATAIAPTDSPRFATPSFSTYFIQRRKEETQIKQVSDFFFKRILEFREQPEIDFTHPVITYFLNALILDVLPIPIEAAKNFMIPLANTRLHNIARACAISDYLQIFKFIKEINATDRNWTAIVNEDFIFLTVRLSCLEFVKVSLACLKKSTDFDLSFLMELLPKAVQRGEFSIVEFLTKSHEELRATLVASAKFAAQLVHNCVVNSHQNPPNVIQQKRQILHYLVGINEQVFKENGHTVYTLLASRVHAQLIIELIGIGANAMAQDDKGNTILHISFSRDHLSEEDYEAILMSIPEVTLGELALSKNSSGETPLVTLVKHMNPTATTLDKLKISGADFNFVGETNAKGYPILAISVEHGRSKNTLKQLIECGARTSWTGSNDKTLLHIGAAGGKMEAVELFLEDTGMDVNGLDKDGLTPLDYAIQRNSMFDIRLSVGLFLHFKGGRFKDPINSDGQSWLHYAAKEGKLQAVQLLLQLGVDVNKQDKQGNTPLHMSAMSRNRLESSSVTKLLLESNADPEVLNNEGKTPFHLSLTNEQLLIETYIQLISKTNIAWSPELATLALKVVIGKGADLEDDEFHSLIKELEIHGVDWNAKDGKGRSLLSKAVKNNDYRCLQLLRERNVKHEDHNSAAMFKMLLGDQRRGPEPKQITSAVANNRTDSDYDDFARFAGPKNVMSALARFD